MINYDDTVETTWTPSNMKYYIEKGYKYTKTREKFMVKIKDLAPNSHTNYPITCDVCGLVYYSNNNSLGRSKNIEFNTCKNCKTEKSVLTRMAEKLDIQWDKLEKVCEAKGYRLITTKDNYPGVKGFIEYECLKHGITKSKYENLINGHGCSKCKFEYTADLQRNSIEKVSKYINSRNSNKLLNASEYIKSSTPNLQILCGCCKKNVFTTSFTNYKHGQDRCSLCSASMSKGEFRIYNYLSDHNIEFVKEKVFPDCRDKGVLFFDFYLPTYNKCIEFDGEQHFNNNFDITMKIPIDAFDKRIRHDKIKDDYCKNNNIEMLRISYKQENYIEEILDKELGIFK